MNELVTIALKGGRYSDAENHLNPSLADGSASVDTYFTLGLIKSNLLLQKNRTFEEVKYCFDKALSLTDNRSQMEKDIMVFSLGIIEQLVNIQKKLEEEQKQQQVNLITGIAVTFIASKFLDSSTTSFGAISSIVGAGFGVGMSLDALSSLGDIPTILHHIEKIKFNFLEYLKEVIITESSLFNQHIKNLEAQIGKIEKYNTKIDISALNDLNVEVGGNLIIDPVTALSIAQNNNSGQNKYRWKTPIDTSVHGNILCGVSIESPSYISLLLTDKGVYSMYSDFYKYSDIQLTSNFTGVYKGLKYFGPNKNRKRIVEVLNNFFKASCTS